MEVLGTLPPSRAWTPPLSSHSFKPRCFLFSTVEDALNSRSSGVRAGVGKLRVA